MKANELRIGNTVNYQAAEGDILPNTIDWQDLKWLSEDEKSFNLCHSPIPLTEEWLLKLGFVYNGHMYSNNLNIVISKNIEWIGIYSKRMDDDVEFNAPKYVHTLQNLIFGLTYEELTLNP
jgi:hypothetical protein